MAVKPSISQKSVLGQTKLLALELALELCRIDEKVREVEEGCFVMEDIPSCKRCGKHEACLQTCHRRAIRTSWDEDFLQAVAARPLRYGFTKLGRKLVLKGQVEREVINTELEEELTTAA